KGFALLKYNVNACTMIVTVVIKDQCIFLILLFCVVIIKFRYDFCLFFIFNRHFDNFLLINDGLSLFIIWTRYIVISLFGFLFSLRNLTYILIPNNNR